MQSLNPNWFVEGHIDLEYQQYRLLAYLQAVRDRFAAHRLYPDLADLVQHLRHLEAFQQHKSLLFGQFPQRLLGLDMERLQVVYEQTLADDELMRTIDEVVAYALPQIRQSVEQGREIYDKVEDGLTLEPVGLQPLYKQEGYLLLRIMPSPSTQVFRYSVSQFWQGNERLGGIQTQYVTTFTWGLGNHYSHMKSALIRHDPELPNPATFVVEAERAAPLIPTLLPITRRRLLRLLAQEWADWKG